MKMVDLSVLIHPGMDVFPGDPPFRFSTAAEIGRDGCNVLDLSLGTHTGTHIDVPRHFLADGAAVDAIPPDRFAGPAVFADVSAMVEQSGVIDLEALQPPLLERGDFLVLYTGWESRRGTPGFFTGLPRFAPGTAEWLVSRRIGLLGTDMPTVLAVVEDPSTSGAEGVGAEATQMHRSLLSRDILLLEGLVNLQPLCGCRLTLFALPLRMAGADGSPVRAVAVDQDL
ncbi:MAG: cyclase family protein [Clostridiaceae bacterium]|nr:cyclase family protein [Clostridiaceae bacterium]